MDVARELRKQRATGIPIVIVAIRTVPKGLESGLEELEIGGRIENIQTETLLRSVRILGRVLEEACCHTDYSERSSTNTGVKNLWEVMVLGTIIRRVKTTVIFLTNLII